MAQDPFAALAAAQKRVAAAKEKAAKQAAAAAKAAAALARLQRKDRDRARAALGGAVMAHLAALLVADPAKTPEQALGSLAGRLSEADRARVLEHLRAEVAAARKRAASALPPAPAAPSPTPQAPPPPAAAPAGVQGVIQRPSVARG